MTPAGLSCGGFPFWEALCQTALAPRHALLSSTTLIKDETMHDQEDEDVGYFNPIGLIPIMLILWAIFKLLG